MAMKKMVMALLAVLLLVGCGSDKKEVEKTPSEFMMMMADVMNVAAERMEKAVVADDVINAARTLIGESAALQERYGYAMVEFSDMSAADIAKIYPTESEASQEAAKRFNKALNEKVQSISMTDEERRILYELMPAVCQ